MFIRRNGVFNKKVHQALAKIGFVLCLLYGIGSIFYYGFINNDEEFDGGTYYAYKLSNSDPQLAFVISANRSCDLISEYKEDENLDFAMDTMSVFITEPVVLVGVKCDSTVGVIKFKNKRFDPNRRESNINAREKRGLISLEELHKTLPDQLLDN